MSSVADPSAGRRHRTLLITDIVRSTEHVARLGDARWRELMESHSATVHNGVRAAGGHVVSDRGDGFLIAFEKVPPALRCVEQLCIATAALGIELRAGLHAGECELLGDQLAGMAVHIAARVSGLAGASEVLVTGAVRDLAAESDLAFSERGTQELRGVPGSWDIYALHTDALAQVAGRVQPRADTTPPVPLPPSATARLSESRLTDRVDELQRCLTAFGRVRAGERRAVLITGEPGIGKTRLAAELADKLHGSGATVLWGRCDPELGVPYQPFVELLTHFARFAPGEVLAQHRARYGRELARLVPELGGSQVPVPATPEQSREENRHVMFAAVDGLLRTAALQRPLVLVLDDLHWADKPTLLMLKYLLVSPEPLRALVLGTYRSRHLPRRHALSEILAELRRETGIERIELKGLGAEDVVELARNLTREQFDPPAVELLQVLSDETNGNPFFLREILRNLSETGGVALAAEQHAAGERSILAVPSSIRETVADRVARLGERAEQVLCAAAVIGREFDAELLARMLEVDEDELVEVLDAAVEAAIIDEVPSIGMRYSFVHSLIHPALYDQLGGGRRRMLHRRALEGLEQLLGEEARWQRIGELAHHSLSGVPLVDPAKSVDYVRQAGEHALEQLAPQEAMRWFEQGLELHRSVGSRRDGDALQCDLLTGRGIAQQQSGDPEFRRTLLEACALASRLGDSDRLVRAALANTRGFVSETGKVDGERVQTLEAALAAVGDRDSAERARLLAILSAELTFAGDWQRRKALSDQSVAIAGRLGDPATLSDVLGHRFITIWTPETLPERLADTDRGLAIAEEMGDQLALLRALHWKAAAAVEAGELPVAAGLVERETELAERLRQPTYSWLAAYDRATQALMRGLFEEAERSAEDAWRIATESEQPEALAFYAGQLLNIRFEQGRLAELEPLIAEQMRANPGIRGFRGALALARSEAGMRDAALEVMAIDAATDFAELSYDSNWLTGVIIYAQACASLDEPDAAAKLHRLLSPWRDRVAFNSATTWGLVERHVGNLDRVLGRYDAAEQALRHAADRHEQMAAPIWLARTRLDLARTLLERGSDTGEAADLLEQARRTAADLGCASVERRSAELLERVREPA